MMKQFGFAMVLITAMVLMNACKNEVGPAGPNHTGNIEGYVTLYNSFGDKIQDGSGVSVTTDGKSPIRATTDSSGLYILNDLTTGVYNLTFNKDSFASYVKYGQQFIGGIDPVITNASLYVPSKSSISITTVASIEDEVKISGIISHNGYYGYYRYFISTDSLVSSSNYLYTNTLSLPDTSFTKTGINTDVFPSGRTIYIKIHGITNGDAGYQNISTGITIYPSASVIGSNVVSTIVP